VRRTTEKCTVDFDDAQRRLKYYGPRDYGTYFQTPRVREVLEELRAPGEGDRSTLDVLELHNLTLFLSDGLFDVEVQEILGLEVRDLVRSVRSVIARYFRALDDVTVVRAIDADVGWQYQTDLLLLLGQYGVFDRCPADVVLDALQSARVGLSELLADERLVRTYGPALREKLLSDPMNAEQVVRKHLERGVERPIFLPGELTTEDARGLLTSYVALDSANANVVGLIATARITSNGIITARLKLQAKQARERLTAELFRGNSNGIRSGVQVSVSEDQNEPVVVDLQDLTLTYSYSAHWLGETTDPGSLLNNFIHVLAFVDETMMLTMPARQANPGLVDRLFTARGIEDYPSTSTFRMNESANLLQMAMYEQFLSSKDVELEHAVRWAFEEFLSAEYDAANFHFIPSDRGAPYLQRCRHLLVEMESIAKQFGLYVENGVLELELMGVAPDQVLYKKIPSHLKDKYAYTTDDPTVRQVMHLLLSDQSGLGYIDETTRGRTAADLLLGQEVPYGRFHDYQRGQVDYLIQLGVLCDQGERVWFAQPDEFVVLRELYEKEATSYYHHDEDGRAAIDALVARGWLRRASSLLTLPEALYFNYVLNLQDFADGPNLRNRYLHGSHADPRDEAEHYRSYLVIMKMLIALTIKINDDFWLRRLETGAI
jgi:hypothetical protein